MLNELIMMMQLVFIGTALSGIEGLVTMLEWGVGAFVAIMSIAIIGAGSAPGGGAPGGAGAGGGRNLPFEKLAKFMAKYELRSPSFKNRFPKSSILIWSDFVPARLEEIEASDDANYWLDRAEQLLAVDGEEEE